MIVMTFYSNEEPTVGPTSMIIKKLCTVLGVGTLITLVVLSILCDNIIVFTRMHLLLRVN